MTKELPVKSTGPTTKVIKFPHDPAFFLRMLEPQLLGLALKINDSAEIAQAAVDRMRPILDRCIPRTQCSSRAPRPGARSGMAHCLPGHDFEAAGRDDRIGDGCGGFHLTGGLDRKGATPALRRAQTACAMDIH